MGTESCTAHTVATSHIAITVGTAPEFLWKAQLSGLAPDTAVLLPALHEGSLAMDLLGTDPSPHFSSQVAQRLE